jgi:acyl CoA:acetate/3-ketoacid CoA transferase beta subunit
MKGAEPNGSAPPTTDEVMTVVAARQLRDGDVCFVGIGL